MMQSYGLRSPRFLTLHLYKPVDNPPDNYFTRLL